jgi:hypothetical protein
MLPTQSDKEPHQVYNNTSYNKETEAQAHGMQGNPVPQQAAEISPIKYVFYIVKENRTYGEFVDDYKANIPVLEGHFCKYYTSWNQTVMDTTRFHQWKRDFDSLLSIGQLPRLNTLRFINDHTEGLRIGRPTPLAAVADNDLAVGLFVEYLSKSKIWKECAVFIVEDDAQNRHINPNPMTCTGHLYNWHTLTDNRNIERKFVAR